jgi:hypothetical protein
MTKPYSSNKFNALQSKAKLCYKIVTILILHIFSTPTIAQDYFISSTGDDSNSGTKKSPFKSLKRATEDAKSDDTIYIRAGVYPIGNKIKISGRESQPITIRAYRDEKVVFQGSYGEDKKFNLNHNMKNDTFTIVGSWLVFKNLEFKNGATSIYLKSNASHNRFENISIHDNYYAGFIISDGASYNSIINCDSYNNFDSNSFGEHADGFVVAGYKSQKKSYAGVGNRFINCRAWGNSDDGFDCWMAGNPVTFINCLSFKNGQDSWHIGKKFRGNGNGFKLGVHNRYGHARDAHLVLNCRAWKNSSRGFDYNDNEVSITLFRNIAWRNGKVAYKFGLTDHSLIQNIALEPKRNYISSKVYEEDNSWNRREYKIEDDIISLDDSSVSSSRDRDGDIKRDGFLELREGSLFFRESTTKKYRRLIELIKEYHLK